MSQLKLIFGNDAKSIHKIKVTILAYKEKKPDNTIEIKSKETGCTSIDIESASKDIVLVQTFEQSMFTMLCDKAHKATTQKFFNMVVEEDDSEIIEVNHDKLDQLGHLTPTYSNHLNQEKAK